MSARRGTRPLRRPGGEGGFTLVELMIAIAVIGIGTVFITTQFVVGYQNWKRNFDELLLQRSARIAMSRITQALREGTPGSVAITTPLGMPQFSQISFLDGRGRSWVFRQVLKGAEQGRSVYRIQSVMTPSAGASTTDYLGTYVETLSFVYPSFQDVGLIDVGLTMRKIPYLRANPNFFQLVERVMLRNP
jgi:prepilin-type N-terminal cleavage/methylation domain-containing protein